MKNTFLLFSVLFFTNFIFAQAPYHAVKKPIVAIAYESTEIPPTYEGGSNSFVKFIGKNFQAPDAEGLSGVLTMTFIINEDGTVSDVKALNDLGHGTAQEAKRVIMKSPVWTPGYVNGKPVKVLYTLPITIKSAY